MKKLIAIFLVFAFHSSYAQDSLKLINYDREHTKRSGMEILGGWAFANLTVGTMAFNTTTGSTHYFYQMNALWNLANLGIAISGYISAENNINRFLTPAESLKQQQKLENIFMVNGGLDIAYIGTGIYLNHRGNVNNSDKLRGYGIGVITQGVFLLLFDITMYSTEKSNGNKLRHFLENNSITFDGKNVGMLLNF